MWGVQISCYTGRNNFRWHTRMKCKIKKFTVVLCGVDGLFHTYLPRLSRSLLGGRDEETTQFQAQIPQYLLNETEPIASSVQHPSYFWSLLFAILPREIYFRWATVNSRAKFPVGIPHGGIRTPNERIARQTVHERKSGFEEDSDFTVGIEMSVCPETSRVPETPS